MASLNKVMLIGNLTKDPEVRQTPGGATVAELRMAITRKYKTKSGELAEEVCYVSVTAWNRDAENSRTYLHKGSPVFIEGRLRYEEWEKDGQKRNKMSVVAERIQFLGSPGGGKGRPAAAVQGDAPEGVDVPPQADAAPDDGAAGRSDADNLPF